MSRIKVFVAASVVSVLALIGLAPIAAAADNYLIGGPDSTVIRVCLRLSNGPDRTCIGL